MKRLHNRDEVCKNRNTKFPKCGETDQERNSIFENLIISLLPSGIGHTRCKLFASQIKANKGKVSSSINDNTTHLIVDDSLDFAKLSTILKDLNVTSKPLLKIVKSKWLSQCLNVHCLLPTLEFEIAPNLNIVSTPKETISQVSDINSLLQDNNPTSSKVQVKWVCSYPSTEKPVNLNEHITSKLQLLAETYKNTKDQWRAYSYEKAITSLKNWPKEVTTLEEARCIPGVGTRLAEKIWEIVESGSFRKLEETNSHEDIKAINLFAQLWGAGPTTAKAWVQQGFRTLDDLEKKAKLTKQQQVGLKHYYDLLEKMPREEAGEIVQKVKDVALSLKGGLEVVGCGSFRRGKALCGDVDILITHPDGKSQAGLLDPIVSSLTESGFLTDHLVNPEPGGVHQTYMGVCRLDGPDRKHRRLDLFVIPADEYGPALLAYTGSGHFNRSMRLLARKKGMALSHSSLRTGVIRKGSEKIYEGRPLPTPTEESVFEHLGLEYRTPEERDH